MSNAVHHLNCLTMAPPVSLGGRITPRRMVAHCLLIEGDEGLVLVDTGFGTEDLATRRMGRGFILGMGAVLDPAETALAQLRALGHQPEDVTDIVVTHLDLDHAGGLGDFPAARVHVFADEFAAASSPRGLLEKQRYIPAQWAHNPLWVEHTVEGETWLDFEAVRAVSDDVLLVPTQGHTRGHCAIAVRRPAGGWFLHAGDAFFSAGEIETPPSCPSGLAAFQRIMQTTPARLGNQARLRDLNASHGPASSAEEKVTIFCAHDAAQYDALAATKD